MGKIRSGSLADATIVRKIALESNLFNLGDVSFIESEFAASFDGTNPDRHWFIYEVDDQAIGAALVGPEEGRDQVWNLLFIAVVTNSQSAGVGGALLKQVEAMVLSKAPAKEITLLVETSDLPSFEGARQFYLRRGFSIVEVIKDYWAEGDDKVVFSKQLLPE